MRIVLTGATGFIGRSLTDVLVARGDTVTALTRNPTRAKTILPSAVTSMYWSTEGDAGSWKNAISEADAVINLAGEPVAGKRWSVEQKAKIRDSRVRSTELLVEAMKQAPTRPKVIINGSAIGYYGSREDETLTEDSPPGDDFLAGVVKLWEHAALDARDLGVRVVLIRTGIVLGTSGGALPQMLLPFKLFSGGVMGPNNQWVSWIHVDDEIGLIIHMLDHVEASGPINATAPEPVTMNTFSHAVGKALHRPVWAPGLPKLMRLVLGERAEAVFASQRVQPKRAQELGYRFSYRDVNGALQSLLSAT